MSVGFYSQLPKLKTIPSFVEVDGADLSFSFVDLPNIRGQVSIIIQFTVGQKTIALFDVFGGFGDYPETLTNNFNVVPFSESNCTITKISQNTIRVDVIPQGTEGAVSYIFVFSPVSTVGPKVQALQDLTGQIVKFTLTKQRIIEGF